MVKPKPARIHQVLRDVVAQDLECPFDTSARGNGCLSTTTQVSVIKVHETIGRGPHLTSCAQLFPEPDARRRAHEREKRGNSVVFSDNDSVNSSHLAGLGGHPEPVSGSHESHGGLIGRRNNVDSGLTARVGEGTRGEKCSTPDGCQLIKISCGESVGETANWPATRIEKARLSGQRLTLLNHPNREGGLARCHRGETTLTG